MKSVQPPQGSSASRQNSLIRKAWLIGLFIAICLSPFCMAVDSAGCRWVQVPVNPMDWDAAGCYPWFMAFDKSDNTLTIMSYEWTSYNNLIKLWKFIDNTWVKAYEGVPDLGTSYHYAGWAHALYYDENIGALMLLSSFMGPVPDDSCFPFLLRYIPGTGFIYHSNFPVCVSSDYVSVSYDFDRNRHIFVGSLIPFTKDRLVTVEYGGSTFEVITNSSATGDFLAFEVGTSGYDRRNSRMVFYGRQSWQYGWPIETLEYSEGLWTKIPTNSAPPMRDQDPVFGMMYVPALGGLLAVQNDFGPVDSWVYRDHRWHQLADAGQLANTAVGVMAYDSARKVPVFYGGVTDGGFYANEMWELHCPSHIRPLAKP